MSPKFRRLWKGIGIAIAVILLAGAGGTIWLLSRGWADLRTDLLKDKPLNQELAERGRRMLEEAARAHGLPALHTHRTFTVLARDKWASKGAWWPTPEQHFRADRLLGTFTSRVELLGGPRDGEIWGLQSWKAYKIPAAGGRPVFGPDQAAEFYLPTLQYFDELPFRLLRAPIALYAGTGTYRGRTYQRVFVTWGSSKPHAQHDQYDVWINPTTGLIDVVRYTVREAVKISSFWMKPLMRAYAAGTIHFENYRKVGGVQVPFLSTVTLATPEQTKLPLDQHFFHRISVERATFDEVESGSLIVDPSLPGPADHKPGT